MVLTIVVDVREDPSNAGRDILSVSTALTLFSYGEK